MMICVKIRERAHITPSTLGQFWTPHPPCVINIIMALDPPPPLKWWCNMWTEVELLDDFSDTFQIIKICFSTIIRTIFWGVGAVFKNIKPWFMKKFISLFMISSILQQYLLNVSSLPPLNLQSVSTSSFCLRPPHPPVRAPSMSSFVPGPPTPP